MLTEPLREDGLRVPQSCVEVLGVVITGILFLVMQKQRKEFMVICGVAWLAYFTYLLKTNWVVALDRWGIRMDNLWTASEIPMWVFMVSLSGMFIFNGFLQRKLMMNHHIIYLLILYPIWGMLQQMLIQSLLTKNMINIAGLTIPLNPTQRICITLITATVFGLIHGIDSWQLTVGTFCLACVWTPHYLVFNNVIPLGLFHGWIGAFWYFLVLRRDPWQELFG